MRKNLVKRGLGLVLSCAMACSLAACAQQEARPTETYTGSASQELASTTGTDPSETQADIRVVAGTVAVAQILDKLGFKNVVGVPDSQYDLGSYQNAPRIGKPRTPDAEVVKSLNPDIFISVTSLEEATAKSLSALNIKTRYLDLSSYDSILSSIDELGTSLGLSEAAQKLKAEIETQAELALKKGEGKSAPKVLFLFGTPKSIMVGSAKSYVGSLLQKLKIPQVQADLPQAYAPLSLENIVSENPDIILVMNHADPKTSKAMVQATFDKNEALKKVNAVKNDKIFYLSEKNFSATGNLYVGEALEELAQIAYD